MLTPATRATGRALCAISLALAIVATLRSGATADDATRFVLEPTEMRREIGLAWFVALPSGWEAGADDVDHPQRSRAVLIEDGRPLGPAHAVHATIRERGGGAWSHWLGQVYFSTSDGSDPRTNDRTYVIELRPDTPGQRQSPADDAAPAGNTTRE